MALISIIMHSSAPVRLRYMKLRCIQSKCTNSVIFIVAMLLQIWFQRGSLCAAIGVVRWTAQRPEFSQVS